MVSIHLSLGAQLILFEFLAKKEFEKVVSLKIQQESVQRQVQKEQEKKRREEERIAAEKLAAKKAKKLKENPDLATEEAPAT